MQARTRLRAIEQALSEVLELLEEPETVLVNIEETLARTCREPGRVSEAESEELFL